MPYYTERFVNRLTPQSHTSVGRYDGKPISSLSTLAVMDSVEMTSFRHHPHAKAVGDRQIVEDIKMDPYAHFLRRTSESSYQNSLRERDMIAVAKPDRGNAFELKRHTILMRNMAQHRIDAGTSQDQVNPIYYMTVNRDSYLQSIFANNYPHVITPYQEKGLESFAQLAYNRSAPTPVVFDAAQFVGELLEGLPRLGLEFLSNRNSLLRDAGSDYLNVEFGWKPLIGDILNAANALNSATRTLARQGKRIHRRYALPDQISSVHKDLTNVNLPWQVGGVYGFTDIKAREELGIPSVNTWSGGLAGTGTVSKRKIVKRWFEGEFSTFYPLGFDPENYFHRFDQLVNTKLTAETLWELQPWSWLVDWGLRLGDSLSANMNAANDLLVMHYGYAMEHTSYRVMHSFKVTGKSSASALYTGYPSTMDIVGTTQYKRRIRANPYGFRVNTPGSLSGGQLAILAALGLTKT